MVKEALVPDRADAFRPLRMVKHYRENIMDPTGSLLAGDIAAFRTNNVGRYLEAHIEYTQTEPCFGLGETVDVSPAGTTQRVFGDVDCDGDVDSVDALAILRKIVEFPVNQEAGCPEIGSEVLVSG